MSSTLRWPFARETAMKPPAEFAQLRSMCPVAKVTLWSDEESWLLTGYEDIRSVLADDRFSSNPHTPGVVPAPSKAALEFWKQKGTFDKMDGADHREHRRLIMKEFMVRRVNAMQPFIEQFTDEALDAIAQSDQPVDLVTGLGNIIPAKVICEMVGMPYDDVDMLRGYLFTFLSQASTRDEAVAAMNKIMDYFDVMITQRESLPEGAQDDLAARLVHEAMLPGLLSREGTRRMLLDMLIGGLDTTSSMISLGTVLLLEHPDQLKLVLDDPSLWPQAIEEMLRYLTIAQFVGARTAMDDVVIGDETIEKGDGVIVPILAANWDPAAFEEPERFDVTRPPGQHVAFGYGIHQCIGQGLARLELRLVFERLFERFPDIALVTGSADLTFNPTTVHTAERVLVAPHGKVAA